MLSVTCVNFKVNKQILLLPLDEAQANENHIPMTSSNIQGAQKK
jgi:hypothetical protein